MRLDSKTVRALALPKGKADAIHFDDAMPGFGFRLRLGSGGKMLRSWVVQYRRAGGTRRVLLGSAEVLSAEQARIAARQILGKVALGQDPQSERSERRDKDKLSLRAMIGEYLADRQREVRPHTFRQIKRYLSADYFKALHSMPIDTVTRRDVAARLVAIKRERGPIVAARARAALSTFFVWAMQMGLVENNPIIGTAKPDDGKPRSRVLSDSEIAAIWLACKDDDFGRIVRLSLLLGSRRAEVGGMCWSEIDLDNGRWRLPAQRSKTGRPHELPLMPAALAIIRAVPMVVGRENLFGSRSLAGFTVWDQEKQALDKRSGVVGWTLHDLRRTLSTRLHDAAVAPHVVEEILGHRAHRTGAAGVYNYSSYEREVRAALALWADHIRTLVEGGERKVVPIHRQVADA